MSENNSSDEIPPATEPEQIVKPVIKPRKIFVPQKLVHKSDKPMEYRTRHIRLSSLGAAQLIRQTILDFQKEMAEQPKEDLDKDFIDQQKVESFLGKFSKKYSTCPTRALGGDLDWISKDMEIMDKNILTPALVETIMNTEKHNIPDPVKTELGYHIILVCETRILIKKQARKEERTIVDEIHKNAPVGEQKTWGDAPN